MWLMLSVDVILVISKYIHMVPILQTKIKFVLKRNIEFEKKKYLCTQDIIYDSFNKFTRQGIIYILE